MKYNIRELLSRFLQNKSTKRDMQILEFVEKEMMLDEKDNLFKSQLQERTVQEEIFAGIEEKTNRKSGKIWLKIAASIIILASIGYGYFHITTKGSPVSYTEIINTTNDQKTFYLVDGTKIILRDGGIVRLREDYNNKTREVDLQGEAFFEVAHNKKKPFIISTGNLTTKVLGTSFNINSDIDMVKVTVLSGLVQVYDNKENTVHLNPNQEVEYNLKNASLVKRNVHAEFAMIWMKQSIRLKQVTLKEFSDFVEMKYDVKIVFSDNELKDKRVAITVDKDDSLEDVIKTVNNIREIRLIRKSDKLIELNKVNVEKLIDSETEDIDN